MATACEILQTKTWASALTNVASVPPLDHPRLKVWHFLKVCSGQSGFRRVESVSVCTHHVQQKQRLIHLIYTMHRVLFTWDIPTESLSLVLLAFQTRQTRTHTFLVFVLKVNKRRGAWELVQPATTLKERAAQACTWFHQRFWPIFQCWKSLPQCVNQTDTWRLFGLFAPQL